MNHYVIRNKYSIPGFLFAAVASWAIALVIITVALLVMAAIGGKQELDLAKSLPLALLVPLLVCGFYAAFGAFSLYMMMWVYWVAVERSAVLARIAWLLLLLLGLHYGATIYALFVWRRDFKKVQGPQPLYGDFAAA